MIRLKERGAPACCELVEAEVCFSTSGVCGESLIKREAGNTVGECCGIHKGEVDALAELWAEGVGCIAEDCETFAMPFIHPDIVVNSGLEVAKVFDLMKEGLGLGDEPADSIFPILQRTTELMVKFIDMDGPEEAEKVTFCPGGKVAIELTCAIADLIEGVRLEVWCALAYEPERTPWIFVDTVGNVTIGTER